MPLIVDRFAADQAQVKLPPTDERRRKPLYGSLPSVPVDNRQVEVAAAVSAISLGLTCVSWDAVAPLFDQDPNVGNYVLETFGAATILDLAIPIALDTEKGSKEADGAPDAAESDLSATQTEFRGFGIAGLLLAGVSRLFTRDVARECRCEAGSFLAAYLLGLPAFSLRPTVLEAMKLVTQPETREEFANPAGVQRILVWLCSPVAAESAEHRQLFVSDPRQALAFLKLLRSREPDLPVVADNPPEDDEFRVRFALDQAELLLRRSVGQQDILRERMETGSATVGNCIGLLE